MAKLYLRASLLLLVFCLSAITAGAQTENLLQNPKADLEARHWRTFGQAAVEEVGGNRVFVVRDGGYLFQDVVLPGDAVGKFAVFIGRGSSERVNLDGAITGLPYLYGYMMAPEEAGAGRIFAYLQGHKFQLPDDALLSDLRNEIYDRPFGSVSV